MTSITIPNTVVTLGIEIFNSCDLLKQVVLGSGLTNIGASDFYDCVSLPTITIPNNVKSIDDSAFSACWALTNISFG